MIRYNDDGKINYRESNHSAAFSTGSSLKRKIIGLRRLIENSNYNDKHRGGGWWKELASVESMVLMFSRLKGLMG